MHTVAKPKRRGQPRVQAASARRPTWANAKKNARWRRESVATERFEAAVRYFLTLNSSVFALAPFNRISTLYFPSGQPLGLET